MFSSKRSYTKLTVSLVFLLSVVAVTLFAWPAYRSHLNTVIDGENEGWNAFYADAAMGKMALYPSGDKLITNNYPPLSFYVVGITGKILGDNILAGRMLSLVSVLIIGATIGGIVLILDGGCMAALVGSSFFIATMSRFYTSYVGMNDPQLLGQAVMVIAFLLFVSAAVRNAGFVTPILLMVIAGFFKHNIVGMPLAAMAWLVLNNRKEFIKCAAISTVSIMIGFIACRIVYGHDFFLNFFSPRSFSLHDGLNAYPELKWEASGILIWVLGSWFFREDPRMKICNLFVMISIIIALGEKCGSGVDANAYFDLIIALSLTTGITFRLITTLSLKNRIIGECLKILMLIVIFVGLAQSPQGLDPVVELAKSTLKEKISQSVAATSKTIEQFRRCPTDVIGDQMILYRSGKSFIVDECNIEERIDTQKLPNDVVDQLIKNGKLTHLSVDPLIYSLP